MAKAAKGGGLELYVVRLLDDGTVPPADSDEAGTFFSFGGRSGATPVRPLVAYRVRNGKEELVRGLTLEGMLPRSLRDIVGAGGRPVAYDFFDGGSGMSGIPSAIVSPALLIQDVDIRKQTGRNRRPPLYPHPAFAGSDVR